MKEATASWSCSRCWCRTTDDDERTAHESANPGHLMLARILNDFEEADYYG